MFCSVIKIENCEIHINMITSITQYSIIIITNQLLNIIIIAQTLVVISPQIEMPGLLKIAMLNPINLIHAQYGPYFVPKLSLLLCLSIIKYP